MADRTPRNPNDQNSTNWMLVLGGIAVLALVIGMFYANDWTDTDMADVSPAAGTQPMNAPGTTPDTTPPQPEYQ